VSLANKYAQISTLATHVSSSKAARRSSILTRWDEPAAVDQDRMVFLWSHTSLSGICSIHPMLLLAVLHQ
jgi:hypothetical protein